MSNETPNKDVTQKHQIPVLFIALSVMIFLLFGCSQPDNSGVTAAGQPAGVLDLPDVYEELVADAFHPAEEYALAVRKIYSIPADAVDAPAPNQSCYGSTDDPCTQRCSNPKCSMQSSSPAVTITGPESRASRSMKAPSIVSIPPM